MHVREDQAQHIANELVERCNGDPSLLDKVLVALQKTLRRITIESILKGNR